MIKFDLKYWLRDYFGFSKKEINGFFVLSFLLLLMVIAPWFYPLFTSPPKISSQDQIQLDSLLASLPEVQQTSQNYARKSYPPREKSKAKELFAFDPNTVSETELKRLGFSEYLTNNFLKYRSKGVKFYRAEQLKKIYGMEPDFFTQIEPYMTFPERAKKQWKDKNTEKKNYANDDEQDTEPVKKYTKKVTQAFDLNQADTSMLRQVKGIGPVLSQRIIEFREKLGGFIDIQQVREVYGISPETADELLKYASLTASADIKKLNINQASSKELGEHPYISKKQADVIVQYRTQHGDFKEPKDLMKIKILNEGFISKLAPYLQFD